MASYSQEIGVVLRGIGDSHDGALPPMTAELRTSHSRRGGGERDVAVRMDLQSARHTVSPNLQS